MAQVHESVARWLSMFGLPISFFVMFDSRSAEQIRNRAIVRLGLPTSNLSARSAGGLQSTRREIRFVNRLDVVAGNP
jgi:hypothetical protein